MYERCKRVLDILVACLLLLVTAPFVGVVALAILLTDGRPLIFWQTRLGQHGRAFWCPKLRSMRAGSLRQPDEAAASKVEDDPRLTPVGRIIRKLSIDELPQLWCVLKGEMSMVGPRPPLPTEAARYSPLARRRLEVKPGLTCLWQVSGRSEIPFDRQVELDIWYVERRSLWLDVKLLLLTVPAVLSRRGAY